MIRVLVQADRPTGPGFQKWQDVALATRRRLVDLYRKTKTLEEWPARDPVWDAADQAYLNELFHGKCAFCEGKDNGTRIVVRHFRPIHGFVLDDSTPHLGYFWLAYEWYNLVPACEGCVKRRDDRNLPLGGAPEGPFPVVGKRVPRLPDDPKPSDDPVEFWRRLHEAEEPLSLDPYSRYEFLEDLIFFESGHVKGGTDRGRETIRRFDLNRPKLRDARIEAWQQALRRIKLARAEVAFYPAKCQYSACMNFVVNSHRKGAVSPGRNGGAAAGARGAGDRASLGLTRPAEHAL
jgi:hypothetical protein